MRIDGFVSLALLSLLVFGGAGGSCAARAISTGDAEPGGSISAADLRPRLVDDAAREGEAASRGKPIVKNPAKRQKTVSKSPSKGSKGKPQDPGRSKKSASAGTKGPVSGSSERRSKKGSPSDNGSASVSSGVRPGAGDGSRSPKSKAKSKKNEAVERGTRSQSQKSKLNQVSRNGSSSDHGKRSTSAVVSRPRAIKVQMTEDGGTVDLGAPSTLTLFEEARVKSVLKKEMARIVTVEPGGSVQVEVGELLRGPVEGRDVVACEWVRVHCRQAQIQGVTVQSGTLELSSLALDHSRLQYGQIEVVGRPVLSPALKIDQALIERMLRKMNVKNPSVAVDHERLVLGGRVSAFLCSVPFRIRGQLALADNNLAFLVDELSVQGKPAGASRTNEVRAKLKNVMPLERVLAPVGVARVDVKGGQLSIQQGTRLVYAGSIDRPHLAE